MNRPLGHAIERAFPCSGASKAGDAGKSSSSPTAQPSSGSDVPKSKSETTGHLYGPGSAKAPKPQQAHSQSTKPQPSSGSGVPTKKEETTGGRY